MVREIICNVLELEEGELSPSGRFREDYGADSMNAVEIQSQIEVALDVEIERDDLRRMVDLATVLAILETAKAR
ncbi:acyl carrier protein [Streptomyces cellostaticus]|uniref:acyl carrier protein n=1 Tax=Streptomyces cellostaticus TaxID=67285 RepID=UPI002542200E|nr:acyl carrier protein [Streptomyces cellostaticus]